MSDRVIVEFFDPEERRSLGGWGGTKVCPTRKKYSRPWEIHLDGIY